MSLENQNPGHPFSRRHQDLYNKSLKYYYSEADLFFLYFYMLSGSIYANYDIIASYASESRGKMINNPNWQKPEIKPYHHQISLDYIEKLVECVKQFHKRKGSVVWFG